LLDIYAKLGSVIAPPRLPRLFTAASCAPPAATSPVASPLGGVALSASVMKGHLLLS